MSPVPMAKYIAQIVVAGVRIVGRAFTKAVQQEYRASQAAAQARAGTREDNTKRAAATAYTGVSLQEAMQILNLKDLEDVEAIKKQYDHLFIVNEKSKGGSFYLQSKVVRAKERIDEELKLHQESEKMGTDGDKPET